MKNFDFIKKDLYVKFFSQSRFFGVTPLIVGMERSKKDKEPVNRIKNHYVLHYLYAGTGTLWVNGKSISVGEKSLFLLSPETHIVYQQNPADPWQFAWIEFSGLNVRSILDEIEFMDSTAFFPKNSEYFNDLFADIVNYSRKESFSAYLKITSLLLDVLHGLIDESKKNVQLREGFQTQKLQPVIEYIDRHYCERECTPQVIAEKFGYSPTYFSRVFQQSFHQTVSSYIIQLRMNQACKLLKHTSFSVSEIAYMIGYSSPFYFSSQFKKLKDYSPTVFRDLNMEDL